MSTAELNIAQSLKQEKKINFAIFFPETNRKNFKTKKKASKVTFLFSVLLSLRGFKLCRL